MKEQEKKIWLFGVFTTCPLKVALEGCPFNVYRQMSAIQRWNYIDNLDVKEVDIFIKLHKECLYKREMTEQKTCISADRKVKQAQG